MSNVNDPRQNIPRPWQPRFGMGTMLLLMLVVSVMGAAASYFVRYLRAMEGGRESQLAFILFTLAAPLVLVVIVSLLHALFRRRRR